jgi:5-methylcytosine-specific restriction protein A
MQLTLTQENGAPLNATIEIETDSIVLHSRSGKSRNRDYRPALEMILDRLHREGMTFEVFLDPDPKRRPDGVRRKLASSADLRGEISEQFQELVRRSNAGSSSHSAWRRLLIRTQQQSLSSLTRILARSADARPVVDRLPAHLLHQVQPDHVHRAVERVRAGAAHNFGSSRDFDLIATDGIRLPPKAVFGLALEEALGIEAFPGHFSAGQGTPCFSLLRQAGYKVVPKDGQLTAAPATGNGQRASPATREEVAAALDGLSVTDEERTWIEGNLKVATHLKRERAAGLSQAKKTAFAAEHGKLFCERCGLDPVAEYGPAGLACIEVHHARQQIGQMEQGQFTRLSDLECLCANCHRVLHRELALQG